MIVTTDNSISWTYSAGAIAFFGILANTVTFIYFVNKERNKGSFGNRLLLLLNTVDAILCLTTFLRIVVRYEIRSSEIYESKAQDPPPSSLYITGVITYITLLVTERTAAELSGLATIILSVSRTIGVWMPFYRIKPILIAIVVVFYTVVMAARNAISRYLFNWPIYLFTSPNRNFLLEVDTYARFAVFMSIVVILFGSTLMIVIKLLASISRDPRRRLPATDGKAVKESKAIKTTIILAVTSIFFNGYFIIISLIDRVAERPSWPGWSFTFKSAKYLAIPLNSVINPAIYFVRIKAIRKFWWKMVRKATGIANGTESSNVMTNPPTRPSRVSSSV
eukprot:sb/3466549/